METFILRVLVTQQPEGHAPDGVLRGVIRQVRTGREASFATWEELRGILAGPAATASFHPAATARGEGEVP